MTGIFYTALLLPALFALVLTFVSPHKFNRIMGLTSSLFTFASFVCFIFIYKNIDLAQPVLLSHSWAPSLSVNLSFIIDGLSLFFGFLVTGVGTLVNFYAHYYMDTKDPFLKRFYIYLNLFTTAMLGCVFSDNLLCLFLFWELTGVISFLLIGYSFKDKAAISSARMVFLVTSLTSLFLLVGIVIIGTLNHTLLWTQIVTQGISYGDHHYLQILIIICFMIAIFGKSAQIPFHFWLPNAMCAPTPISAYLHSATMVKLGVFLTARMYPLFVTSEVWFPLVVVVCLSTMLLGAIFSLLSNDLKMILAYATVSQLGFFISIYGMGDVAGVAYDFVHILNHAFYKGSLFMLVGIIHHATGIRDIRKLGGLWSHLPLTFVIFLIATLAMAGVPGTTGFISKELVINDLLFAKVSDFVRWAIFILIVSASIFKVAFSIRLFFHLFIREKPSENVVIKPPHWQILIPPGVLSICALGFGVWPTGLEYIVERFYVSGLHAENLPSLKIWHGWSLGPIISFSVLGSGVLLFYVAEKTQVWSQRYPFLNFGVMWNHLMDRCVVLAHKLTLFLTGRSIQRHLATLLLSFSIGIAGILLVKKAVPWDGLMDVPVAIYRWAALIMIIGTTLAVPFLSGGLSQVLALASSGFFVTLYFIFYKAPDLAMTQILVEIVTGIMLLVMVWVLRNERKREVHFSSQFLRSIAAFLVSLAGVAISLSYSGLEVEKPLTDYFLASTIPLANGANAVNTILVDFRGLDTLGEITVLLIAVIAIMGLIGKKKIPDISWENKLFLVPSNILRALTPALFLMINIFAIYLLIRGHNQPGGGFIAGLASSIAFILIGLSLQLSVVKKMIPINLVLISGAGVAVVILVGLVAVVFGGPFLTHNILPFPSALIFDIGVFMVVLGVTLTSIFALRSDALKEGSDGVCDEVMGCGGRESEE